MQKAFVLDLNRCTGCDACSVACANENQLAPGTSWRSVDTFNAPRMPGVPFYHLSLACNHCADPPCMNHCPALAYAKDPDTGVVVVDTDACIGCKYCTWACPYDAPRFDAAAGVVTKCTLCHHRLAEGQSPACVAQCPTGALQLADLDTAPGVDVVPGFPRTEAGPALRFIPLRGGGAGPEVFDDGGEAGTTGDAPSPPAKVTLAGEWPLVSFTLLAALLVGLVAAPGAAARMNAAAFGAVAAAAMGLSTLHLGRKLRAWRAILGWRRSWLSREIILFSSFAAVTLVDLARGDRGWLHWVVVMVGFAALVAVDNVYVVTRTRGLGVHSARVLLTGAMVAGLVSGSGALFVSVAAVKLVLYVYRQGRRRVAPGWVAAIRVAGLVAGIGLWATGGGLPAWGIAAVALSEIIDRCEFYAGLDVPTPKRQIVLDLRAAPTPSAATG